MNKKIARNFVFDCLDSFKLKMICTQSINIIVNKFIEILFLPYLLKIIGDKYQNNTLTMSFMLFLIFIYTVGFSLRYLINVCFWKEILYNIYVKFDIKLRQNIFNFIIKHSMNYFNNTQAGIITGKIENIISSSNRIIDLSFRLLSTFIIALISFFIYLKIDYYLFLFLLIWSISFLIYNYYSSRTMAKYTRMSFIEQNKMSGLMTDDFINISNIKATSKQHIEKGNVKKQGINILKTNGVLLSYDIIFGIIMFIFMMVLVCFMFMYSVKLFMHGKITIGSMIFTGQNIILLSFVLKRSYKEMTEFIKQYSQLCDGFEEIMQDYDIIDKSNATELKLTNGKIVFSNIKFKY